MLILNGRHISSGECSDPISRDLLLVNGGITYSIPKPSSNALTPI
jgi:hypothetical protein